MPELRTTIYLPPTETVKVWQVRDQLRPTVRWSEMMHEEHAIAFTVAKIAKLDLLRSVQESLDQVITNGGTFERWKANLMPELQRHGWWGRVQNRELTGTGDAIVVNDRRLRNIYNINIRMSIAGGRWRRFQAQKAQFPYLRYRSDHPRKHPREQHLSWHGTILPIDHIWWQKHFPPNGWGCHCLPEQVSEGMLRRRGWKVSLQAPSGIERPFYPAGSGQPVMVPAGIDPGFGYNPGTAHLRAIADKALTSAAKAAEIGLDRAAQQTIREIVADPAFEQFMALPDAQFPIAVLNDDLQQRIQAQSKVITLPSRIVKKQVGEMPDISIGHPELQIDDYRVLPDLINNALVIAQQGDSRLVFFLDANNRLWKAIVRQDDGLNYPAIVSFHRSQPRKLKGELRTTRIIFDVR